MREATRGRCMVTVWSWIDVQNKLQPYISARLNSRKLFNTSWNGLANGYFCGMMAGIWIIFICKGRSCETLFVRSLKMFFQIAFIYCQLHIQGTSSFKQLMNLKYDYASSIPAIEGLLNVLPKLLTTDSISKYRVSSKFVFRKINKRRTTTTYLGVS